MTPSSSITYSPPHHTTTTPPSSHSPCGSSTPYQKRHPPSTKPWNWHVRPVTGGWSQSSPTTMSRTLMSSTSQLRCMLLTANSMSSRQQVVKAVPGSKEPVPTTIYEAFRPLTPVAPLVLMRMRWGSTSAMVGCCSRWRVMTSFIIQHQRSRGCK